MLLSKMQSFLSQLITTLKGHAVTLKRKNSPSQLISSWYLLDSQNRYPKALLTQNNLRRLQGNIIPIRQGSVWDGLDPSSDLRLADSSFPFNPKTFAHTIEVILLDTTQEPTPTTSPSLRNKTTSNSPVPACNPLTTNIGKPLQTPSLLTYLLS